MSNLIISYPNIAPDDYAWIQNIRKLHDPKYFDIVKPHIALVFGTEKLNPHELLAHAKENLKDFQKIRILLDSAIVVEDDSKSFFHTFLRPSTGYERIIQCHDLLYSGVLSSELRLDIPFIPHVGIGTSIDETEMQTLAKKINSEGVSIQGLLDTILVVQFDGTKVVDLESCSLAEPKM
jgi:hypothetical protein